jgi:hypothetical protein
MGIHPLIPLKTTLAPSGAQSLHALRVEVKGVIGFFIVSMANL